MSDLLFLEKGKTEAIRLKVRLEAIERDIEAAYDRWAVLEEKVELGKEEKRNDKRNYLSQVPLVHTLHVSYLYGNHRNGTHRSRTAYTENIKDNAAI